MGQFPCTCWKHVHSKSCSHGALYPSETWPSLPMEIGLRWPASRSDFSFRARSMLTLNSEVEVKIVDIRDMMNVIYLREHTRPAKHVSFHPSGSYVALSCTDGIVYIYSISTELAKLVRKIDGVIRSLETFTESTSRAIWHPDGRAFAAPTATRDIQVVSRNDGERQRAFSGGHMDHITALAWSPNGALLLSAGSDRKILLWETKTQKILSR
jgi:chromosome transmission fidelity protein 4